MYPEVGGVWGGRPAEGFEPGEMRNEVVSQLSQKPVLPGRPSTFLMAAHQKRHAGWEETKLKRAERIEYIDYTKSLLNKALGTSLGLCITAIVVLAVTGLTGGVAVVGFLAVVLGAFALGNRERAKREKAYLEKFHPIGKEPGVEEVFKDLGELERVFEQPSAPLKEVIHTTIAFEGEVLHQLEGR